MTNPNACMLVPGMGVWLIANVILVDLDLTALICRVTEHRMQTTTYLVKDDHVVV